MSKPGLFGSDLREVARHVLKDGPHKTQPTSRRVRVIHHGSTIVDTTKAVHVWEHPYYPYFYIPTSELKSCVLKDVEEVTRPSGSQGDQQQHLHAALVELTVKGPDGAHKGKTDRVVRFYQKDGESETSPSSVLDGLARLEFASMDHWLEEDIPIYVHPKDPYKRVDLLPSSRPIEVRVGNTTVARAAFAVHLLETGLPTRYYLPLASVDPSFLRKSDLITKCPYKGEAEYYDIVVDGKVSKNLVWYYRHPTIECAGIAGFICFYNEKVDIVLDGELLKRP